MLFYVGLNSKEFALKLLRDKRVAVAPGTAFNTFQEADPKHPQYHESQRLLQNMCRISLANSLENVSLGIHKICDLLDETRS
jgi:aspartate/methionine/tyrosine aminotransferase